MGCSSLCNLNFLLNKNNKRRSHAKGYGIKCNCRSYGISKQDFDYKFPILQASFANFYILDDLPMDKLICNIVKF